MASAQEPMQIGLGGALLFPAGDYGGTTAEFYQGKSYGLSAGPGFHLKGRFECAGLSWFAQIEYFVIKNHGEAIPGQGRIDISGKLFVLKAGPEVSLDIPSLAATAYFGGDIAINNIGGDIAFQAAPNVPDESFIMNSASRLGFGFTAGLLMKLNPRSTLDVGASFNVVNPFRKSWTSDDPTARVSSYRSLNDAADPLFIRNDTNHFLEGSRSVNAFVVAISVLFAI
ncbi:MAG: hypothetical protein WBD36_04905 [Bacteroidota bacterium]